MKITNSNRYVICDETHHRYGNRYFVWEVKGLKAIREVETGDDLAELKRKYPNSEVLDIAD